jgi:quinoprotein glucose dehydrogenase
MISRARTALTLGVFMIAAASTKQGSGKLVEWPVYGGDPGGSRYSTLTDINRENVSGLTRAWTWATGESPIPQTDSTRAARPGTFQATPLMVNDTFTSARRTTAVALDANTGRSWRFDPGAHARTTSNGTGFVHRGVALWTDGRQRRCSPTAGGGCSPWMRRRKADASFENGEIDVTEGLAWAIKRFCTTPTRRRLSSGASVNLATRRI